jgi:AhpD family alkylhydroperoxidase
MSRMTAVDPEQATGKAKELLEGVNAALGVIPNMAKTMAVSPALLEGWISLNGALGKGTISPAVGERIALAVAERNGCSYCLSAHSYLGEHVAKLSGPEIDAARSGESEDPLAAAALRFATIVLDTRGHADATALAEAREAGLTDAHLAEIVGLVALNVLTNYFNTTFEVDVDFPLVTPRETAATF